MKKSILVSALAILFTGQVICAQEAAIGMSSKKNITENIATDKDLTALKDGMNATSMAKKLEAKGNFTFFAITNDGFNKTLHGGIPKMMSEEYLPTLNKILSYHTVEGVLTTKDLKNKVELGHGIAMIKSMSGESLKITIENNKLIISDSVGNKATVVESDLKQKNGIVHIIDALLLPAGI